MIRSKDGNIIAIATITTMVRMRIITLEVARRASFVLSASANGFKSTPKRTSMVPTMGRQLWFRSQLHCRICEEFSPYLRGTFVTGMIAMNTTMHIESALGYPLPSRILDVISSLTELPNINQPITAMERSSKNYEAVRIMW